MTNQVSPGPYSKTRMRVLAVVGVVMGVLVLIGGIAKLAQGDPQGPALVTVAALVLLIFAVFVPVARRRGRL